MVGPALHRSPRFLGCSLVTKAAASAENDRPTPTSTRPRCVLLQVLTSTSQNPPHVQPRQEMAQPVKDSFLDLERHRRLLEENIEKLRKSLRHWQTWEAEYEGLKEEILATQPPPNPEHLMELARNYEADLVNQKEISDILGNPMRTPAQIVNLLDRRIDYVEQSAKTLQRQIEAAENKLAAATVISTPEVRNEEGLPLTEIVEELDDDGNVISGRISTSGSTKPQLLEVLRKAGVHDIAESEAPSEAPDVSYTPVVSLEKSQPDLNAAKKGVKFSVDSKAEPDHETSPAAKRIEAIMEKAEQEEMAEAGPPIIPTNESLDDAVLRKEMLQYGMSEVGALVAELEVEEGSDWSDEDYDDVGDGSNTDDDEDAYGRSTSRVVNDELRQQMIKLEERLGVRMMDSAGQRPSDYSIVKEGIGRVSISAKDHGAASSPDLREPFSDDGTVQPAAQTARKSVRFSEELDISPAPMPSSNLPKKPTAPVTDIIERTTPPQVDSSTSKKTSRFKSNRADGNAPHVPQKTSSPPGNIAGALSSQPTQPSNPTAFPAPSHHQPPERTRITPSGPEGKTLAPEVVERDIPLDVSAAAPDELDPYLLHQEVAVEYHKMRNKMIQRQGGFMKEDESEIVPRTEEEGGPKKMSRFKAARLAKS